MQSIGFEEEIVSKLIYIYIAIYIYIYIALNIPEESM